jgi:hypothetical protein
MKFLGVWAIVAASLAPTLVVSGCYIDNPNAAPAREIPASTDGAADGALADAGDASDSATPSGPSLCEKYGGYATVEKVVGDLVNALVADCRVSRFFTVLTTERQTHLYDCLVKQVAVVMRCPGIRYDVDNAGVECRDMKTSHKGLSIRNADFDALVQDLVGVLLRAGMAQADIDALAPAILDLRADIVTNSAPGHGRQICDAGGGG